MADQPREINVDVLTVVWKAGQASWKGRMRRHRYRAGRASQRLPPNGTTLSSGMGCTLAAPAWSARPDSCSSSAPGIRMGHRAARLTMRQQDTMPLYRMATYLAMPCTHLLGCARWHSGVLFRCTVSGSRTVELGRRCR
jgi:hypothetical protein